MMLSSFTSVMKAFTVHRNINRITDCCNKLRQHRSKTLSSHRVTVTDDVSKLCHTNVTQFLDLGAKVDEIRYRDLLLSQQLLPAIRHVSSEFIF